MSASPSVFSDEASRKRMRKGTHSCTECRRRKKSCVTHPNGDKCVECTERGVECISQDTRPPKRPRVESKQSLQERIVTLENTVHAIIDRLGIDPSAGEVRSTSLLHSLHTSISTGGTADTIEICIESGITCGSLILYCLIVVSYLDSERKLLWLPGLRVAVHTLG